MKPTNKDYYLAALKALRVALWTQALLWVSWYVYWYVRCSGGSIGIRI